MRKKIKIDFIDFWPDLDKEDNFFIDILNRYYDVEISDDPDYVFCSFFDNKHLKYRDCIKILYMGENLVPDFNLYDYAMGFHYIDFEDRYLCLPHYALYTMHLDLFYKKHTYSDEYYLSKKGFCNCVISNPFACRERDEMYEALCRYKDIDCGGRYHNNVGGPVPDKIEFEKKYRFTMAFENSSTHGYTTEKILEAFAGDTIPIYWGDPTIASQFDPASFVNCHDFKSFDAAVDKVKEINENDSLFLDMIKTPALKDDSLAARYLKPDYADAFLRNIFDQDIGEAIRRNMVYVGNDYQKKAAIAGNTHHLMDIVRRPVHFIKKTAVQAGSKKKNRAD
ncbi:MAG: hypothetical protein K6G42_04715 [Lachnospiraceae bacterium]|nr:hypothetical protein [Lachnospiraceae bacterium]